MPLLNDLNFYQMNHKKIQQLGHQKTNVSFYLINKNNNWLIAFR